MEIELKKVDRSNWLQCVKLNVGDAQREFVAPAAWSIVRAAYEPETFVFAICRGDEVAGLVSYEKNPGPGIWEMIDLMVDERFQGQGIGKAAIKKLFEIIVHKLGHIKFYTSVDQSNSRAASLYEKVGFRPTGNIIHNEALLEIQL